ncbi:MAG: cytosolic protein [Acholeplasmataceae bacterium]|nr:cytosolic protein [Acholeplasmataceae bacterium]HPT89295.1 spore coat protein YlbD [Bacilli bacterium]HQA19622.1 spore coat protein YlbD [Bacilli bacterium]HQD91694.1 spore coat protein YlbD [Bacilli bacterium]
MESKLEQFKDFVRRHPLLRDEVRNNRRTWQSIYEEWVLYGENDSIWEPYRINSAEQLSLEGPGMDNIKNIISYLQKINPDTLQKTLNTVQKAIQIAQSITQSKKRRPRYFDEPYNSYYDDWWD